MDWTDLKDLKESNPAETAECVQIVQMVGSKRAEKENLDCLKVEEQTLEDQLKSSEFEC